MPEYRTEVSFRFSSFDHPGCRIFSSGKPLVTDLSVAAERDVLIVHVHEVACSDTIEERGATRVHGRLSLGNHQDLVEYSEPFDVRVLAYNPVENQDYRLEIMHCYLLDTTTGDFQAAAVRPWYNVTTKRPAAIPTHWHDLPCRVSATNANGDSLPVGEVKNWKPKTATQHVDKSVPSRTYQMNNTDRQFVAGKVTVAKVVCEVCGALEVDVITGVCQACSYKASFAPLLSSGAAGEMGASNVMACDRCGTISEIENHDATEAAAKIQRDPDQCQDMIYDLADMGPYVRTVEEAIEIAERKMKLSEIRKACESATPGPWEKRTIYGEPGVTAAANPGYWALARDMHDDDARFIALARTALPALLEFTETVFRDLPESAQGYWIDYMRRAGIEVDE